MFIGHYSASFVLKRAVPTASLRSLMLGVQFVDILFMIFILFGIERMRLIPGTTASNALQLDFMPYTHSLVASFVWGAAAFCLFRFVLLRHVQDRLKNGIALAVALSVISHYFFDLPVHVPDLPIFGDDSMKLGFGLWNHRNEAMAVEFILTAIGFAIYLRGSQPGPTFAGKFGIIIFCAVLLIISIVNYFLPPPKTIMEFSAEALAAYFGIAFMGGWLDSKRVYPAP